MLLLMLPPEEFRDFFSGRDQKKIPLKDLFDIQIGLLEDKYSSDFEGMKKDDRLFFVRLSSIEHTMHSFKSLEDLEDQEKIIGAKREKAGQTKLQKPLMPVPKDRLLSEDDYIISTRGKLNGFSMARVLNDIRKPQLWFVPSHHFITLRPSRLCRLMGFHIPYLHIILDTLVSSVDGILKEKKMKEWEERKEKYRAEYKLLKAQSKLDDKEKKRLKMLDVRISRIDEMDENEDGYQPVLNALSIKDIEDMEINVLWSIKDQEDLVENYKGLLQARKDAEDNLDTFIDLIRRSSELPNPKNNQNI